MAEGNGIRVINIGEVEEWVSRRGPSREICGALAARAALRASPLVEAARFSDTPEGVREFAHLAAPVFRATALARVAATYPNRANELRHAAALAADAANAVANVHASARVYVAHAEHEAARDRAAHAAAAAARVAAADPAYPVSGAVATAAATAAASAYSAAASYAAAKAGPGAAGLADYAAHVAYAADAAFWEALSADLRAVEAGASSRDLADRPLFWPDKDPPPIVAEFWRDLAGRLPQDDGWRVWTRWYDARLKGESWSEARELIYATVPEEKWNEGPAAANAWIAERLAELDAVKTSDDLQVTDFAEAEIRPLDFFLSYNREDEAFARFIDDVLRKAGFRVFVQFRDMPAGSNFVREMIYGLAAVRFVSVLSPRYLASEICMDEWSHAYNDDRGGRKRRVVQFVIEPCELPPLMNEIVHVSLVGLSGSNAAAEVLRAIGYEGRVTPEVAWPGAQALDQMSRSTRGVFDVRPTADGRLDRVYVIANDDTKSAYGFSKEELYEDARDAVLRYLDYLRRPERANYDQNLSRTAVKLLSVVPEELAACRPLKFNRALVEALSAIEQADRLCEIPRDDFIRHYQAELRGLYERLAALYPQLVQYRETARKDRQTPLNDDGRAFLGELFEKTATVATNELAQDLRETNDALRSAEASIPSSASEAQRKEVMFEPLKSASAQAIPVWNWLANAGEKFKASGKSAAEASAAIESYTKLSKQIPGAGEFFKWLGDWWY